MSKRFANREYKDSVFRMIFSHREYAGELAAALLGEKIRSQDIYYENPGGLFTRKLQHDVAFRVMQKLLVLLEQQSTPNENMPVRFLIYVAEIYGRYLRQLDGGREIYKNKLIPLFAPEFFMFYNGKKDESDKHDRKQ